MRRIPVLPRFALALWLALYAACATPRAGSVGSGEPQAVETSPLPGGRLKLSFEPVPPNPALETLNLEEAQAVLKVFHEAVLVERPRIRILAPSQVQGINDDGTEEWERQLRGGFEANFGQTLLPVPGKLEQSRLFRALRLSPRYMGPGVREAAREMFASPIFVASVYLTGGGSWRRHRLGSGSGRGG